jgi:hypothetical protein
MTNDDDDFEPIPEQAFEKLEESVMDLFARHPEHEIEAAIDELDDEVPEWRAEAEGLLEKWRTQETPLELRRFEAEAFWSKTGSVSRPGRTTGGFTPYSCYHRRSREGPRQDGPGDTRFCVVMTRAIR